MSPAADMLAELDEELQKAGIELVFAEMKDPVKDKLKRFGLFTRLGSELFFPTLGQAVNAYLEMSGVEWVDWEDERKKNEDDKDKVEGKKKKAGKKSGN